MDNQVKPHADTALDPQSLDEPPTSDQYYLYSRIDGDQTVDELCRTSGLGRQATLEALKQLHHLGLIVVPGYEGESADDSGGSSTDESTGSADATERSDERPAPEGTGKSLNESTAPLEESSGDDVSATAEPDAATGSDAGRRSEVAGGEGAAQSGARTDQTDEPDEATERGSGGSTDRQQPSRGDNRSATAGGVDFSRLPVSPNDIDIEPELLEMDVDLGEPFRRELVALSRQLDDVNYYEFYGIQPDADVGEIKKSYFHLSKRYHPDKHFGGELGPFEEMLEEVFQHITRAYRILTDEDRREDYDAEVGLREGAEASGDETSTAAEPQTSSGGESNESSGPSRPNEDDKQQKQQAASRLLVNRARKYREQGAIDEAADEYRKAVSLNRRLETALEAAEMLVDAEHRLDDAAVFARAALKLDDSSVQGYYLLGRSYEARDRQEEAVEAYRRIEALDEADGYRDASRRLERLESEGETS